MPNGDHHVTHREDGKWQVKREGGDRASTVTDTKQDAINQGREISRNQGTELIIHNKDGKISQRDSHGNDPYPPKG